MSIDSIVFHYPSPDSVVLPRILIDQLFQHVRASCQFMQGLLVYTDGFASYPRSIVRAFREKVKKHLGRGSQPPGGASSIHCYGDQTYKEETGSRSHPESDKRNM